MVQLLVNEPILTVFSEPKRGSKIEDVLRYGQAVDLLDQRGKWARVKEGWVLRRALLVVREIRANARVSFRGAYVFSEPDTERGPFFHLPFEAPLHVVEELTHRWLQVRLIDGRCGYVQRSHVAFDWPLMSLEELIDFSKQFLGLNYLYGGTSSFGYDCSGFVQMLYRQLGLKLPRNCCQQAEDPRFVDVKEARAGDLVFFFNAEGKVTHVAMMIDAEAFIHAYTREEAWVCIGSLDEKKWRDGTIYYGVKIRRLLIQ